MVAGTGTMPERLLPVQPSARKGDDGSPRRLGYGFKCSNELLNFVW